MYSVYPRQRAGNGTKQTHQRPPVDAPGQGGNAVIGASCPGFQADDHTFLYMRMFLDQGTQSLQVLSRDAGAGLGLNRHLHIPYDEIYLNATGQTPIAQNCIDIPIAEESREFMEEPVLKGLPVQFGSGCNLAPPYQPVYDTYVGQIEFGGTDKPAFDAAAIGRQPLAQQRIFQIAEITFGRLIGHATFASVLV